MAEKILITGVTGFIGNQVLKQFLQKNTEITAIIRPNTNKARIKDFAHLVNLVEIDLTDIESLKKFLAENNFDSIIHIGALRGGRKATKKQFHLANVDASEQLMLNAIKNDSNFIFCSSVGVFGAIPLELPANNHTPRQKDNYYHTTKILAEALLQKYVLHGLKGAIIRPAITYGAGDFGFPFTLIKLVDKQLLRLPDKDVTIHLTNVHLLAQAFVKLSEQKFKPGMAFNIADPKPIKLLDLADYISRKIHQKKFSSKKIISKHFFELGESISKSMKNELWTARFQLISKSWYYEVAPAYEYLSLKQYKTIPDIDEVINWYLSLKKKGK
ncbi:MAG: NAD(P)-dependent oxidoreductase [Candidatus Cloacimonetes bacterium]|nr:NAD(P)-dependent oxidoreductase [Candidatus Cloacimonadota bacterium]